MYIVVPLCAVSIFHIIGRHCYGSTCLQQFLWGGLLGLEWSSIWLFIQVSQFSVCICTFRYYYYYYYYDDVDNIHLDSKHQIGKWIIFKMIFPVTKMNILGISISAPRSNLFSLYFAIFTHNIIILIKATKVTMAEDLR